MHSYCKFAQMWIQAKKSTVRNGFYLYGCYWETIMAASNPIKPVKPPCNADQFPGREGIFLHASQCWTSSVIKSLGFSQAHVSRPPKSHHNSSKFGWNSSLHPNWRHCQHVYTAVSLHFNTSTVNAAASLQGVILNAKAPSTAVIAVTYKIRNMLTLIYFLACGYVKEPHCDIQE